MLTENGTVQGTEADTIVFTAGSDGNHVILQDAGSCKGGTVVSFTLNGNSISLPATAITDGCGQKYTARASGSLSGSTLTMNIQELVTADIPNGSSTGADTVETINATIAFTLTKK